MKKTLLSIGAALAVIGAANAGIKETCLEHPDKLVWVESTQRCLPINTCKSDDQDVVDAYCNRIFKDARFAQDIIGQKLVYKYVENVLGLTIDSTNYDTHTFGQDYIHCKLSNGGYMTFEFDNLSETSDSISMDSMYEFLPLVYNAPKEAMFLVNNDFGGVDFILTPVIATHCDDIAHLLQSLYGVHESAYLSGWDCMEPDSKHSMKYIQTTNM